MKNKQLVLDNIYKLRNNIKSINYLINTGCSFDELVSAFQVAHETLDHVEGLVDLEFDPFRTNQVI